MLPFGSLDLLNGILAILDVASNLMALTNDDETFTGWMFSMKSLLVGFCRGSNQFQWIIMVGFKRKKLVVWILDGLLVVQLWMDFELSRKSPMNPVGGTLHGYLLVGSSLELNVYFGSTIN